MSCEESLTIRDDSNGGTLTLTVTGNNELRICSRCHGVERTSTLSPADVVVRWLADRIGHPPQTEEDLTPLERERLAIITQLEQRWSMAGGAKRDGLAAAIVVVKSRNLQPPSEGS